VGTVVLFLTLVKLSGKLDVFGKRLAIRVATSISFPPQRRHHRIFIGIFWDGAKIPRVIQGSCGSRSFQGFSPEITFLTPLIPDVEFEAQREMNWGTREINFGNHVALCPDDPVRYTIGIVGTWISRFASQAQIRNSGFGSGAISHLGLSSVILDWDRYITAVVLTWCRNIP
jgi:hypothetical protein